MKQFRSIINRILHQGIDSDDRTGTGTKSVFGHQMRFTLSGGKIPLLHGKRVPVKSTTQEVLWLISGSTNVVDLINRGVKYWTEWPYEKYKAEIQSRGGDVLTMEDYVKQLQADDTWASTWGDMGPIYPEQWRAFKGPGGTVDQLQVAIDMIKNSPNSRRIIVDAWQPTQLCEMTLPPCHMMYQFYVRNNKLSCQVYIRSNDMGLGAPTNMYMYALLTHMVAHVTGTEAHELVYTIGDAHIYNSHDTQIGEYMNRPIDRPIEPTVTITAKPGCNINDITFEDIMINDYDPLPAIKMPIAV